MSSLTCGFEFPVCLRWGYYGRCCQIQKGLKVSWKMEGKKFTCVSSKCIFLREENHLEHSKHCKKKRQINCSQYNHNTKDNKCLTDPCYVLEVSMQISASWRRSTPGHPWWTTKSWKMALFLLKLSPGPILGDRSEKLSFWFSNISTYSSQLHFCCVFKHGSPSDSSAGTQHFEKLDKKGGNAPHAGPGQRDRKDSYSAAVGSTAIASSAALSLPLTYYICLVNIAIAMATAASHTRAPHRQSKKEVKPCFLRYVRVMRLSFLFRTLGAGGILAYRTKVLCFL